MVIKEFDLTKWFGEKVDLKCGVELELLLFDSKNKEPLSNHILLEKILKNLPIQIYRDFYTHQLEIRTKPHGDPDSVINEAKELYRIASKEFLKHRIFIIPAPSVVREGYVHCGLHLHISYPKGDIKKSYFKRAMGMYPFVLSLADHSKNFEENFNNLSKRLESSRHIGLADLTPDEFYDIHGANHKYKDIILSPAVPDNTNRSRLEKPDTIEIRILDTPSLFTFFSFIVKFIMNLASQIRVDNPMVTFLNNNFYEYSNRLTMTRELLINQRYGVNKIFRMLNVDVCEEVSNYFKIDFPKETQFEFRERLGLSADVNGFLSMAIKGGWL